MKMMSLQDTQRLSDKFDPEDMYYLMSRGLDKATAERLVVRGFLGSVIVEIPVKEVRDEMIATIEEKLSKR